ncbi:MAG: hypothetical protein OEZ54_05485, partial [Gemmatimonadota bacterium]|nr:hypothetical protein [Gemmatimonadota bacterium]
HDSVLRDALAVFTGRNRWLNLGSLFVGAVFFGLAIYSAIRFMGSQDLGLHGMLLWGFSGFFCLGVLAAMKVWYWLELQRITLARELKRLELQVAHLARTIANDRE